MMKGSKIQDELDEIMLKSGLPHWPNVFFLFLFRERYGHSKECPGSQAFPAEFPSSPRHSPLS
jgi:hypothetical protein